MKNNHKLRKIVIVIIAFMFCCTNFVSKADRQRGICDNCGNYVAKTSKVCPTCKKTPHYNEDMVNSLFYGGNSDAAVKAALMYHLFGVNVFKEGDNQPSVKSTSPKSKKSKKSKKQSKRRSRKSATQNKQSSNTSYDSQSLSDYYYDKYFKDKPKGINGPAINYEKPENYNLIKGMKEAEKTFNR